MVHSLVVLDEAFPFLLLLRLGLTAWYSIRWCFFKWLYKLLVLACFAFMHTWQTRHTGRSGSSTMPDSVSNPKYRHTAALAFRFTGDLQGQQMHPSQKILCWSPSLFRCSWSPCVAPFSQSSLHMGACACACNVSRDYNIIVYYKLLRYIYQVPARAQYYCDIAICCDRLFYIWGCCNQGVIILLILR